MSVTEAAQAADETDASVLEAAAAVLLRRYGTKGGGAVAGRLSETAAAIRRGPEPAPAEPEPPREGWGVIRPGDRRAHYYVNGMSLCRRVGFYGGQLWPDLSPSPDDHKECRRLLVRRKATQAIVVPEAGDR